MGAYAAGSDPQVDQAIAMYPRLMAFLRQDMSERVALDDSLQALRALARSSEAPAAGDRAAAGPVRVQPGAGLRRG